MCRLPIRRPSFEARLEQDFSTSNSRTDRIMALDPTLVLRFRDLLVEEIRGQYPHYLQSPFTVAEIYQSILPYRVHRDQIGVAQSGDYDEALLRLLSGDPEGVELEPASVRDRIRKELATGNPNTAMVREFAALSVRLRGVTLLEAVVPATEPPTNPKAEPKVEAVLPAAEVAPASPAPAAHDPTPEGSPCPECSKPLPKRDTLRFCPHCGENVHEVPCRACGEVLDRSWAFCVACGESTRSP